jgi:hypothetical protein
MKCNPSFSRVLIIEKKVGGNFDIQNLRSCIKCFKVELSNSSIELNCMLQVVSFHTYFKLQICVYF